jgi:hypothetical protein
MFGRKKFNNSALTLDPGLPAEVLDMYRSRVWTDDNRGLLATWSWNTTPPITGNPDQLFCFAYAACEESFFEFAGAAAIKIWDALGFCDNGDRSNYNVFGFMYDNIYREACDESGQVTEWLHQFSKEVADRLLREDDGSSERATRVVKWIELMCREQLNIPDYERLATAALGRVSDRDASLQFNVACHAKAAVWLPERFAL